MCVFNTGSGCLSSTCASGEAVKAPSHSHMSDMIHVCFSKGRAHDDTDDGRVCKCQGENASPWALCVCVSVPWANKLHEGKLRSTCPHCHALTHPHSHTFPLSTQHPILSKDEERAKPCMRQRPSIQIKMVNPLSFLSLSLDMFLKASVAHCVSLPLLSCV